MTDDTIKRCIETLMRDGSKTQSDQISALLLMRRDYQSVRRTGRDAGAIEDDGLHEDLQRIEAALKRLGVNPAAIDNECVAPN